VDEEMRPERLDEAEDDPRREQEPEWALLATEACEQREEHDGNRQEATDVGPDRGDLPLRIGVTEQGSERVGQTGHGRQGLFGQGVVAERVRMAADIGGAEI